MLNGYEENIFASQISDPIQNEETLALKQQNYTYKLIRKTSDFFGSPRKGEDLFDLDSRLFREFEDPLDKFERDYMLKPLNEQISQDQGFFESWKGKEDVIPFKNFLLEYKEDIKQKYIFNFVTNDIGKPNFFQVSSKYLVIGTKYGFLFTYNLKDKSHYVSPPFAREKKMPIICLDISYDEELVVCGYLNGSIGLYEITTSRPLKSFQAIHSGSSSVLAIKFYHNNIKSTTKCRIISSDSEGKVFKTYFEKNIFNIWNYESYPIIEKNAGQIINIEILKSMILNSSESTKNVTIVALASSIKVCVIQIEPKNSVIYVLPKPSFVKDAFIPSISWDEGLFKYQEESPQQNSSKSSEKSIYLIIFWEKYLDLLSFKENYDEENDCFSLSTQIVGSLILNTATISISFISLNLIVGITDHFHLFFLSLDDIKQSDESLLKSPSIETFREKYEIEIKLISQIPSNLLKLDLRNENSSNVFIIAFKKDENSFFFLEKREKDENFGVFEVFSWPNFLNQMMKVNKKAAIHKMMEIYEHGSNDYIALVPKVAKIRKKSMKDFMKQMMKNYLLFYLDMEQSNEVEGANYSIISIEDINKATKIVIDFIIKLDEYDFFFHEIVSIFKDRVLLNVLFLCLEGYIENKKFRVIPEDFLIQMISFYKQEGKLELIQKLILSLDLHKVDNFQIIAICMEFQLFKPLIYICTIYNNDFLTPLVKIASHYYSSKINGVSAKNQIGFLFLWYIKLCLSGKTIVGSDIEIKMYELVIQQLVLWIFVKENLIAMLEIDAKFTFDICYLFFTGLGSKIIRNFYSYLKINCKVPESIENSENVTMIPQMKMLCLLFMTEEDLLTNSKENSPYNKQSRIWFFVFFARILDLEEYNVDPQKCFEAALHILKNPEILNILFKSEKEISQSVELEKSKLVIKFLKAGRSWLSVSHLNQLLDFSSKMEEVGMYLYIMKKEFMKAISICLNSKNELLRTYSFFWIKEIYREIKSLEDSSVFLKKIGLFLIENFKILLSLNEEEAFQLIRNHLQNYDPFLFLGSLREDSHLELEFIEKIFRTKSFKEYNDEFLNNHLELLCKLKPNEVLENLKIRDYPLDCSIEICKIYDLKEPQAFLYLRSGAVSKVLDIYMEIFCENLKRMKENPNSDPEDLKRISQEIINVSQSNSFCDIDHNENLWFENFSKLTRYVNQIFNEFEMGTSVKEILKEIFSRLIFEMWENMPHEIFIEKIKKFVIDLELGILRESFLFLVENSLYEGKILKITKNMFQHTIYQNIHFLKRQNGFGQISGLCSHCQKKIEDQKFRNLIIYKCEHSFHEVCYKENSKNETIAGCPKCYPNERNKLEQLVYQNKHPKKKEFNSKNINPNAIFEVSTFHDDGAIMMNENDLDKIREKKLRSLEKFDKIQFLNLRKLYHLKFHFKVEEFVKIYEFDM